MSKMRITGSRHCRRRILRRHCRNIRSRSVRARDIYGRRDIGATRRMVITGYREPGRSRRKLAICGRRDIGDLWAGDTATIMDFGGGTLATTAGLIMDSVMWEWATRAGIGMEISSTTTVR